MKYLRLAATTVAALLALVACSDSQQFPSPTGKGSFRAINAISTSPTLVFRIEESAQGDIGYRTASETRRFDDFEYNFNFDILLPGEDELTRIATTAQKINANRDHTFVATGSTSNASVLTWITDERVIEEGATVAQIQLAHLASSVGQADVYLSAEGTTPALGEARGTYSFGEILPPFDIEQGNYTLTVTAPGDPSTVLYESILAGYLARSILIVAIFDGTVDDTFAVTARALAAGAGTGFTLPDVRSSSTMLFVQGSEFVGTADIYDDEDLTNRIVAGLPFAGFSDVVDLAVANPIFRFTPADSTETVLLEQGTSLAQGRRYDFFSFDSSEEGVPTLSFSEQRRRRPVDVYAQVGVVNTLVADGVRLLNAYLLEPGETIEDRLFADFGVAYGLPGPNFPFVAGTYDLVFARPTETTPIADPIRLTLSNGDVERFVIFATPDPNVFDIRPQP